MKLPKRIGCLGIGILLLLINAFLFRLFRPLTGTYLAIALIIGIAVGGLLLYSYKSNKRWEKKLIALNNSRPQMQKEEFTEYFVQKGYKQEYIDISYRKLKNFISLDGLTMYPEDDIYDLYRVEPMDFSDLIETIFKEVKKELPAQQEIDLLDREFENHMRFEYILKLLSI